MSELIIGLHDWFSTPAGRYLLEWERTQVDAAVADIFGYHALQLGLPALDTLQANRMPSQWLASDQPVDSEAGRGEAESSGLASARQVSLYTDFSALPFPASSLDLVVLPHTLELASDPHATLREVHRVLVPEGRVVITGLSMTSLWGICQRRTTVYQRLGLGQSYLPASGEYIALWRVRDWLRLLGFEVELQSLGCYRPAVHSEKWLQRFAWMDRVGKRWWPIFGAAYFLVAVKRVRGMRVLGPAWKAVPARNRKSVSVANFNASQQNRRNPD